MGKITVKHYLNKAVKPRFNGKTNTYPIYVQIIADRVNYKMKSNFNYWDGYITDLDFNSDFVKNSLNEEQQKIEKVVLYLIKNEKVELLNTNSFKKLSAGLWDTLNSNFWNFFIKEVEENTTASIPNAFINATFFDIDEILAFTQSEIEQGFSSNYHYASIGMKALLQAILMPEFADLRISEIAVFEFLFESDKRTKVLEAVTRYYSFTGRDKNEEYNKVLEELENIIADNKD